MSTSPADPTSQYCRDVVSGKIISGESVIASAERHLADLVDGPKRGLVWRPDLAEKAIQFFPAVLTVTGGSHAGKPFILLPWQTFVVGSLYGWLKPDGSRRFRSAWIEIGRGQAKTPLLAGVALLNTFFSGVPRAESYVIGETVVTSNSLFKDAVAMVRATLPGAEDGDSLESRRHILVRGTGDLAWQLEAPATSSKFQCLAIGDAISGPKPVFVAVEECHELKSSQPIEMWQSAIAKMSGSPLMMLATNTPAVDQTVATDYSAYFQSVAKREFHDDSSLSFIARTDPKDDPLNDETCWPKSLPALGITFDASNVRTEVQKAKALASKRLTVLRLFFGVPVGTADYWIDQEAWEACLDTVDEAEMRDYPCFLGLDMSMRHDLTALAKVWKRPDGHLFVKIEYWKPKEGLAQAVAEDHAPYDTWAEMGQLHLVPGKVIGKDFIAAAIKDACISNDVQMMAYDPAFFLDLKTEMDRMGFDSYDFKPDTLAGSGLKMFRHAQGARGMHTEKTLWMPRSFSALCDAVLEGRLTVDRTGLTTWCSANTALGTDGMGNQWPDKRRSRSRIDGIAAMTMAVGAAMYELPAKPGFRSIWDNPEFYNNHGNV